MRCIHVPLYVFCAADSVLHWLHRQRQKRSRLSMFPGGEDFSDKFAPPMVLFMAEEQVQQLGEHTRKVEIDSAPSWTCFEYVLDASSSVNTMLETALRCGLLRTIRLHGNTCWSCRQSQQQRWPQEQHAFHAALCILCGRPCKVRHVQTRNTMAAASTLLVSHCLPAYVSASGTQIQHLQSALMSSLSCFQCSALQSCGMLYMHA